MAAELDHFVEVEYQQLGSLVSGIEACSDHFEEVAAQDPPPCSHLLAEMAQVITDQQGLINSLRAYSEDLENTYKCSHFKMQSLVQWEGNLPSSWPESQAEQTIRQLLGMVGSRREEWHQELSGLQIENQEIKSILDSMIRLVREDKGLHA